MEIDRELSIGIGPFRYETWLPAMREEHPHDHPYDFKVFPLKPYVELVYHPDSAMSFYRIVKSYHWHRYKAVFSHTMLGHYNGHAEHTGYDHPQWDEEPVPMLTITGRRYRNAGFWVSGVWVNATRYLERGPITWLDVE